MREILKALEANEIEVDEAEALIKKHFQPKLPTAVLYIDPIKGIQADLHNWEGVSMVRMEQMYHTMLVASQRYRASQLLKMRQEEKKDAA